MAITSGSGANFIDRTGQRFGRWAVIERTQQKKNVRWVCRCDCGTVRDIASSDLQSGGTNSCGCIRLEGAGETLQQIHRREFNSWSGIKQRCYYHRHIEFNRYGGRGIVMCAQWENSFAAFLADMGPRPSGYSIERKDNDGPYNKNNCKWASRSEQMNNTSKNIFVEHNGQRMTLKQLATHLGVNYFRLHAYYRRRGFSLDEAIERALKPGINRVSRCYPA